MKNLLKLFTLLMVIILFSSVLTNNTYAAGVQVKFVVDAATPINGVTPQLKAGTSGTPVLSLELRSINLPDGTPLNVIFTQYNSAAPYGPLAPVTIGTVRLTSGGAKAKIDATGKTTGVINGLIIATQDGTQLLHAIPMRKA